MISLPGQVAYRPGADRLLKLVPVLLTRVFNLLSGLSGTLTLDRLKWLPNAQFLYFMGKKKYGRYRDMKC